MTLKSKSLRYALVLAGSLALGGTLAAQQANQPAVNPSKVVLSAGDVKMTAGEFEDFINSLPAEVQAMARGPAKRRLGEDILKLKLLAAEARKRGLDQTPRFKQQMEMMRDNALAGALMADVKVSDEEIQKFYEDNKLGYERATVRHILIAVGGDGGLTDDQAKAKAEQLRARLTNENFEATAKAESHDPGSKDDGGALEPFTRGQMVPEFEEVAFKQNVGEISQPVKTKFGYHIVQTQKREVPPLADLKDEIAEAIKPQKLEQFIEQLKKQMNPMLDESYFGPEVKAPPQAANQ